MPFNRPDSITTDFVVVGGGVAGLRAAIELTRRGRVILVNKSGSGTVRSESASTSAQGGIAVARGSAKETAAHLQDTLSAGKGLCRRDNVSILVSEGPKRFDELVRWGARFDRRSGRFLPTIEAGHSHPRIFRAHGDATGLEIVKTLARRAGRSPRISLWSGYLTADLIIHDGRCVGIILLQEFISGPVYRAIFAKAVVLAAGGAGAVYARTTNPPLSTGDGMAMAFRAGAEMEDMEFVQFHPTALAMPSAPAFLITEAFRGEGAVLRDRSGKAFMSRYDPSGDLATRDIVSRAIWEEMRSTATDHVYLDATHLGSEFLKRRFPTVSSVCSRYGLDIGKSWIPVSPAAHFMIGGIKTDRHGRTSIPGLYAAGEVAACGIHGANRLASNSLLEGLVFGVRAANAAAQDPSTAHEPTPQMLETIQKMIPPPSRKPQAATATEARRKKLQRLMWENVGIVRSRRSLQTAVAQLQTWEGQWAGGVGHAERELWNLLTVAKLITTAAMLRAESLGVHYREDAPRPGIRRKQHLVLSAPPTEQRSDGETGRPLKLTASWCK
jgi:L-aspartate oxidase